MPSTSLSLPLSPYHLTTLFWQQVPYLVGLFLVFYLGSQIRWCHRTGWHHITGSWIWWSKSIVCICVCIHTHIWSHHIYNMFLSIEFLSEIKSSTQSNCCLQTPTPHQTSLKEIKPDRTHEPECSHFRMHKNERRNQNTCLFFVEMTCTASCQPLLKRLSCLTLLLNTLSGHSCLTLLLDTPARHFRWTLLLDTFAGHSCLTLFLDTFAGHSFLSLFARHSCWTVLTGHSCLTHLLDTLAWHPFWTLFFDTLARTLSLDTLAWLLQDTLDRTPLLDTFAGHSC